jgi:hypothetical protein
MKKTILTVLGVAASFAAFGQGTVNVNNIKGSTIYFVLNPDGTQAKGANYSVEVLVGNTLIGSKMTIKANGSFALTGAQTVPGVAPGTPATLTARAWDNTTGATYDAATTKGTTTFKTAALGGDTDGDPSTPPATSPGMVSGLADGFQGIQMQGAPVIPEPSTIALGAIGAAALLLRRRK